MLEDWEFSTVLEALLFSTVLDAQEIFALAFAAFITMLEGQDILH